MPRRIPNPGLPNQEGARLGLRVGGFICLVLGLGVLGYWLMTFTRSMGSIGSFATSVTSKASQAGTVNGADQTFDALGTGMPDISGPVSSIWMPMVGTVLLGAGIWMLRAGFLGTAVRYVAGETMPVAKDAAGFLTDGEGFMNIGRTEEIDPGAHGRFCSQCGTPHDVAAKYCDSCGTRLS